MIKLGLNPTVVLAYSGDLAEATPRDGVPGPDVARALEESDP